ncbi:pectate lyase [Bimuria novae-zelandiae CBS 107.79]|uniref:Pectate lyase n=1 Tax=Bimuria novae-zelandiae CBS 107.79 TaxID=1447943 RepID=A0A6A5UUH5_9PLEO|nr:pectate lyase [Bimuria novae-zelandiae CBS 107.79]
MIKDHLNNTYVTSHGRSPSEGEGLNGKSQNACNNVDSKMTRLATKETAISARAVAPSDGGTRMRVQFYSPSARDLSDNDWSRWWLSDWNTTMINNVKLELKANATLKGGEYKQQYRRPVPSLGERIVNQGITTETNNGSITLTIAGLPAGEHTLTTWHNAWEGVSNPATVSITANGTSVATGVKQTSRVDNVYESGSSYVKFNVASSTAMVVIVYVPSGGDGRVFLNGIEIDGPSIAQQISFPSPANKDEWVDLKNSSSLFASWRAPSGVSDAKYNVYVGTEATSLNSVATGVSSNTATLTGLNTLDTFYWRVDVVSGNSTYIGRVYMFRGRQLAFPGAEGWGRFARGGRGGKVVKVTSLEDSTAEGTLRYALTVATGPRIVVFDVGGVITTKSRMTVNSQYITVAAQTAPGKGIVIQGWPVGLSGGIDVIIRHMRVRPGKISGSTIDGMGMQGSNHCIFDHCSISWTIDESFSSRAANNITLQRTMIAEPLNDAGHKNYPAGTQHGYAASIGGNVGSFHHNLIAHAEGRSWSMAGGLNDSGYFAGRLDIRNNVVYNFGGRTTDGGANEVNFVGNYYKPGPNSKPTYDLSGTYEDAANGKQQYYCEGNSMVGKFDQNSQQVFSDGDGKNSSVACTAKVTNGGVSYQKFFDSPFFESYVETQPSTEAYKRVVSDTGARSPVLDDHDKRIVNETVTGTQTYKGSKTGKAGIIDDPEDVGGLEDFPTTTRAPSWDADNDGIADWWDGSTDGEGYTPIEGYINFMAEPHVFVSPGKSVEVDLISRLAAGFKSPTFTASGSVKGTAKVSGGSMTYTADSSTGIDYVDVAIKDSEGSTWTRKVGVAIFEEAESAQ